MDRIRRFICVVVPTSACNLRCRYCYLHFYKMRPVGFECIKHSAEEFRRAMSKERLGGVCMFNFTANGETLIDLRILDYVRAVLAEGHFVEIVTNATIARAFDAIAAFPGEYLERLLLKCSFHYLELKDRGLLDVFFKNVNKVRAAGASITVELMPHDEILPFRDEIRELTVRELGAPCHLTVGRDATAPGLPILTRLSRAEYASAWSSFRSELFDYKLSVFGKRQVDFCYAGEWMAVLNLASGKMSQCYKGLHSFDVFEDADKGLPFLAIGNYCREPHCFNAHAWLTFGCVPTAQAPCYDVVRNRKCADGSEWLQPRLKAFFHQKFADGNDEYDGRQKKRVNRRMFFRKMLRMPYDLARDFAYNLLMKVRT